MMRCILDENLVDDLFASFHFAESPVNLLTGESSDPVAKCPEYKITAVQVEKVREQ